jgi:hypothetical protein
MQKIAFIIVLALLVAGSGYYAWSKGVFGGVSTGQGGTVSSQNDTPGKSTDSMVKVTDPVVIKEQEATLVSCIKDSADDKQIAFCHVMAAAALADMSICDRNTNTDKSGCKTEVQKLWEATKDLRQNAK